MRRGLVGWVVGSVALLVLVVAVAGTAVAPGLPFAHGFARQRWLAQAPAHYTLDALWAAGGWSSHVLLEVRDGRLVGGTDLRTGAALAPIELGIMGHMFPVERLFEEIAQLGRWPDTWRGKAARLLPFVARRIDPCSVPPPQVRYDPLLGYPAELQAYTNPCFNGVGYNVRIVRLTPLP